MIINYFKVAFRSIFRNKIQALINITGLSIGLASAILILLFVWYEFSYDKFHPDVKNTYLVYSYLPGITWGEENQKSTSSMLVPTIKEQFPEIKYASRIMERKILLATDIMPAEEEIYHAVDADFLKIFAIELLQGHKENALTDLNSVVVSERIAKKYFSGLNPIGQHFKTGNTILSITGVFKDMPLNSHFHFDILRPFDVIKEFTPKDEWGNWLTIQSTSIIQLNNRVSKSATEEKLVPFIKQYLGKSTEKRFYLQPITDIHLKGSFIGNLNPSGSIKYVMIFGAIGLFILLIASFNYMNLSTAQSLRRAKEVGLRKVIGANRSQLIKQFLGESFLLTIISFIIALVLIQIFIPYFNEFVNRDLKFTDTNLSFFLLIFLVCIGVALLSGSYPALYLSRFIPVKVMKGSVSGSKESIVFRNILIVFQFVISISLIVCTIVVVTQLNFMKNKNLGYETENILSFRLRGVDGSFLKDKLAQHPGILDITGSDILPYQDVNYSTYNYSGAEEETTLVVHRIYVDYDFLDFYDMDLIKGEGFTKGTEDGTVCLISQETSKKMGLKDPIGTSFEKESNGYYHNFKIIGEFSNFHHASLHQPIKPSILVLNSKRNLNLSVKIHPNMIEESIAFIESQYNSLSPRYPFTYQFIEDSINNSYSGERRLGKLFNFFTVLAVFIACLGLYGLVSFIIEQRTKEIGIRKVLGATIANIVSLLSKYFIKWVLLANLIAWPIAWYFMNQWLSNFAFHIRLGIEVFLLAGAITFFLAAFTAGFQSLKVALNNPIESLKYE